MSRCAWIAWLALVIPVVAPAQEDAADSVIERPLGPRRSDLSEDDVAPGKERPGIDVTTPAAIGTPDGTATTLLYVNRFRFTGNTVIDTASLQSVAAPYEGRDITDLELQELRRALTALYVDAGYVTSSIVIPDQDIVDGVVTLQAVEGGLGEVQLHGVSGFDRAFLARWIAGGIEAPIHVRQLEQHLLTVLQDPAIDGLNPQLVVGDEPGTSTLRVDLDEAPRFGARAGFADDRSPAVGGIRGELELLARNVLGRGDVMSVSLEGSRGLRVVDARADVPVNTVGTRLLVRLADYDTQIIEEPLDALDIESESRILEVGLQQALVRSTRRTVNAGVSLEGRNSESFLLGVPFSFNPGAVNGRAQVRAARLRLSWLERRPHDVFSAQAVLSVGLDILGATVHGDDRPDSEFHSVLLSGQWLHSFGGPFGQVYSRLQAQQAGDALLPLEKMAIGGTRSVRGYRRARHIRDSGWDASLEYRQPLAHLPVPGLSADGEGRLSAVVFVDAGRAWNEDNGRDPGNRTLFGAGPGFRWEVSQALRAEFYWAAYTRDLGFDEPDIQDRGIHFQVGYHTDF